jgi:hypothetical protein
LGVFAVFAVLGVFAVFAVLGVLGVFAVFALGAVFAVMLVYTVGATLDSAWPPAPADAPAVVEGAPLADAETVGDGAPAWVSATATDVPPRMLRPIAPVTAQVALLRVNFMMIPFVGCR